VAHLVRAQRAQLGVVISASHNPYPDNGIKFFSHQGSKLDDEWELRVEAMLDQTPAWVASHLLGKSKRLDDAAGRYIEFCKSTFDADLSLHGLKLVVDAAHGAAYHIAPRVFQELGAEVVAIACQPDGLNINEGVGATHTEHLVAAVRQHHADWGVALDGDADRLIMVDGSGRVFNGDELLYVLAMDRLAKHGKSAGVVGTLMTNMAIELALKAHGIELIRAKVGDRYVLEALNHQGWLLGGEGSGHLLVLDQHTTGDGIVSALQVLQVGVRQGCGLSKLLQGVDLYPQHMINVKIPPGTDWNAHRGLKQARDEVDQRLQGRGRVLIRPSGTEPVLRIMVEAQDASLAAECAKQLALALA
jgi:phosphoglucosamine mutase